MYTAKYAFSAGFSRLRKAKKPENSPKKPIFNHQIGLQPFKYGRKQLLKM